MREYDPNVYGYVNGKPTYSRDEHIYVCRGFGAIESDTDLMAYAEKATHGWYNAGWKRNFTDYYLSDYACSEPYRSLTSKEFTRLKELQCKAREELKRAEIEKCWKLIETTCWADNSVEEVYEDKDGNRKTVIVVAPHGDAC